MNKTSKPLSGPQIAKLAGYTPRQMLTITKRPDFPGELVNPGRRHRRYRDTRELRDWCQERSERRGPWLSDGFAPQENFFSRATLIMTRIRAALKKAKQRDELKNWTPEQWKQFKQSTDWINEIHDRSKRELARRSG
jgi:hypothetical protein